MPPADFDPDSPHTQHALRGLAEQAAHAGGTVAKRLFTTDFAVQLKADRSEVSDVDRAAQAAVIACIRARRPGDAFVVEERLELSPPSPAPSNDMLCWVVDPIDGTRNYVRHIPLYACSVAAMFAGVPLLGAIYDPQRDRVYSASRRGGFFVNGQLRPAQSQETARQRGADPKPVVAIPSSPSGPAAALAHVWLDRFVCRNLGSTALHLALVASGELSGMLADNPRLWDLAAGWVLVTAAGGKVTTLTGDPLFPLDVAGYVDEELPVVASAAAVHDQLLAR